MLGPREKDFAAWDRAGELPASFVQELRDAGLFGLVVPEPHGGLGLGATAYSRVIQELGKYDGSTAVSTIHLYNPGTLCSTTQLLINQSI